MSDFEKEYYEAESFWNEGQLLDEANVKRIKATASLVPPDVSSLLDVGCGNGVFLNYLFDQSTSIELTGIDRSAAALKHVKTKKLEGDITQLPFTDSSFDCVSCLEVIEHLPVTVYEKALGELARIAKKYIIVSVPFEEKLEDAHTQCPNCKTIFNTDLHFRSFEEKPFTNLLNSYGFKNVVTHKLGEIRQFKGHKMYRKLFYPEQILSWTSPICPLCGFCDSNTEVVKNNATVVTPPNKGILALIRYIPKLIWPKEKRYYWILGLFEKC